MEFEENKVSYKENKKCLPLNFYSHISYREDKDQ